MASLPEHLKPAPIGRRKLPREVREEHQRDRIVGVATEVFAKRGYQATTVDHLVVAARIGVGTFYSLFEGKEDCFLQVYDRVSTTACERIAAAVEPNAPWSEQVCSALRALLELVAAEPLHARVALVEVQTAGSSGRARHEATLKRAAAELRRGRELTEHARTLPGTLEDATIGGILWLLQQRTVRRGSGLVQELHRELMEMVLEPYLGERDAARVIAAWAPPAAEPV
jgi:AcrR family transcriptional regulator